MNGWDAFRIGLSRAARYRRVLAVLFAVGLASASLLAVPLALHLLGPAHRPAIREAAGGVSGWLVIETLMTAQIDAVLTGSEPGLSGGALRGASLSLLTAALLPLMAWLSSAFLGGGVLLTYVEDDAFRWRRFLWGCWHWFGAFLLLGILQTIATLVLFVPLIAFAVGAITALEGWLAWVAVPTLVILAVLWLALMESTRVVAVSEEKRNVFRAFGRAVQFVFRHLPAIGGLYGLSLAACAVLIALYRWGLMASLPLEWWLLAFVLQQIVILARLGVRLARLAGNVALYRAGGSQWLDNLTHLG